MFLANKKLYSSYRKTESMLILVIWDEKVRLQRFHLWCLPCWLLSIKNEEQANNDICTFRNGRPMIDLFFILIHNPREHPKEINEYKRV